LALLICRIIPAARWRSAWATALAELARVDKKLATRKGGATLGSVVAAENPAQAFLDATLMGQRAIIEALVTVRPRRAGKGRLKRDHTGREVIDLSTVVIQWQPVRPRVRRRAGLGQRCPAGPLARLALAFKVARALSGPPSLVITVPG
jgi:hypothetical protein